MLCSLLSTEQFQGEFFLVEIHKVIKNYRNSNESIRVTKHTKEHTIIIKHIIIMIIILVNKCLSIYIFQSFKVHLILLYSMYLLLYVHYCPLHRKLLCHSG